MKTVYAVTMTDKKTKQLAILGMYSKDPNKARVPVLRDKNASIEVLKVDIPVLKGASLASEMVKQKVKEAVFNIKPNLEVVDIRTHNAFLNVESDNIDTYVAIKIIKRRITFVTLSNTPIKREGVKNILVTHKCDDETDSIIKAASRKLGHQIWWSKQSKFIG